MKHLSLAAKYRPQNFSEVVGQELAIAALSRAAAEDKVAPAYLLSGTRGVGKTTIARIFAKALNCERGPAAEPCNICGQCVQITGGNHVDVNEIDGASNTGVDDVRALRENIGYLPMEGRYKIFIVDEAHMLSKNAFNALLKTLEEPPSHTTFIFATTEAHRFPATIISRCQHFVFRSLPEEKIYGRLCDILHKENFKYEESAVRMIAARAAGSARDSLSLLDQVLSLCGDTLDAATTRASLGLAGREFFDELFAAISVGDCVKIVDLARSLLQSGADIGFFVKELAARARALFLYGQSGDKILPALSLAPDETASLRKLSPAFAPAHLHAAWQMTLENQRAVSQNPDPGSALELLLINLALLPRLLPIGDPRVATRAEPGPAALTNQTAPKDSEASKRNIEPRPAPPESSPPREEPPPFSPAVEPTPEATGSGRTWDGFREFCENEEKAGRDAPPRDLLCQIKVDWRGDQLELRARANFLWERLNANLASIKETLNRYCDGSPPVLNLIKPLPRLSQEDLKNMARLEPDIQLVEKTLNARLVECQFKNTE